MPLHNDFVKFWNDQGIQLKNNEIFTNAGKVIVHSCNDGNDQLPRLSDVVAFEYGDGEICYRINNINYQEEQALRVIKLKIFL